MKKIILTFSLFSSVTTFAETQTISREELDRDMQNYNQQLNEARAVPEMRDGQLVGYRKVEPSNKNSGVYENLELKQGEMVTSPNNGN